MSSRAAFDGSGHVGELERDAQVLADRLAELHPGRRVLGRELDGGAADADGIAATDGRDASICSGSPVPGHP